jgi:hypothetical protein
MAIINVLTESQVGDLDDHHEAERQIRLAAAVLDGFRQPQWSKLPYSVVRG